MKRMITPILTGTLVFASFSSFAQNDTAVATTKNEIQIKIEAAGKAPIKKPYWGNSLDGMIFSTALIDKGGDKILGTLRFSMFFHIGATYNYNFSKNIGIYTGLDLKNIGLIEKFDTDDRTDKKRVYTLGVPVGLRLGNMKTRDYFFMGGGLDVAFHYKEKSWSDTYSKTKSNDWFSKKTEILMPYIFAGVAYRGTTFKIQYYPTNFLNENFEQKLVGGGTIKPFAGKNVNLLLFSVGRDMNFGRKK